MHKLKEKHPTVLRTIKDLDTIFNAEKEEEPPEENLNEDQWASEDDDCDYTFIPERQGRELEGKLAEVAFTHESQVRETANAGIKSYTMTENDLADQKKPNDEISDTLKCKQKYSFPDNHKLQNYQKGQRGGTRTPTMEYQILDKIQQCPTQKNSRIYALTRAPTVGR